MNGRRLAVAGVAVATALALAAPAGATTFCVPTFHPACPDNGTNVQEASLETAVNSNASDGIADTALVDAVTVTNPDSITVSGSDALLIQGAGPAATTVTNNSAGNVFVLNLLTANSRSVTVRDLTIAIPATAPDNGGAGSQMSGDTFDNVDVVSLNPGPSGSPGITGWLDGATVRNGEIRAEAGGALGRGISSGGFSTGSGLVENMTIRGAVSGITIDSPTATAVIRRSSILDADQVGVSATGGTTTVENSVITTLDGFPLNATANSANPATINADHVTAVNTGTGNLASLSVGVNGGSASTATLNVSSYVARGYNFGHLRQGPTGTANLTVRFSNLPPGGTSTGNGTLTTEANFEADPLFASATDFHLLPGSPSIDAGDPAPGGLAEDFDAALRPTDGNADGVARRDQGAFEYQPPQQPQPPDLTAPQTTLDKGPGKKIERGKARFRFSSNEVGSSFECKLDKKAYAGCTSPRSYKQLKPGKHKFFVRATDAAGNQDQSPVRAKFRVPRR